MFRTGGPGDPWHPACQVSMGTLFVTGVEPGYEIKQTQIVSLSALLYCPIGSTENRSLRHGRFSLPIW